MRYSQKAEMKTIFLLTGLHLTMLQSAQECIIGSARHPGLIYLHVDNPLTVFVEGYSCSSLIVTTDNGKIKRSGCYHNFMPARLGPASLTIYHKQNRKSRKVRTFHWDVVPLPKPIAQVGGFPNVSEIPKGALCAQSGVAAYIPSEFGFELMFRVVSFSFMIMRDSAVLLNTRVKGYSFTTAIQEACVAIQPGSVVLIASIEVKGPDGKSIYADPLQYFIK